MMEGVKYEPLKRPKHIDKFLGFIFLYPSVYFLILIVAPLLILVLQPHAIIFTDTDQINPLEDIKKINYSDLKIVKNNLLEQYSQEILYSPIKSLSLHQSKQCSGFTDNERFDCFPQEKVTEDLCNQRGCCWGPVNTSAKGELGVPFCYYPSNYKTYQYVNISYSDVGATAYLENLINSSYPDNIQLLKIDFNYVSENLLQIKIYDPKKHKFESHLPNILRRNERCSAMNTSYMININKDKLGFNIIRKSNNVSIFDTENIGGFIFADQFLQISARLPSRHLYGLGQQRNDFLLDMNWRLITLFNHDQEPTDKSNLYGSHPFYLAMEDDGSSSAVLLHNNHAMDIILQPTPAITYRAIGGSFDFYFFLGPSPADVVRQYTERIGRPFMPPYWSLGFHLCRFGYKTLNETITVWNRTRAAGIPLDTQWNDIDYMDKRNDFTYDKVAYKGLPDFVNLLHQEGMHYMIILDPGVSAGENPGTYPPYDEGLKEGIFIMDPIEEKPFLTKVWNSKSTVLPDFFNPKTKPYWHNQIKRLHDTISFDGLWIDMNEPSTEWDGGRIGCPPNNLDNPPYLPAVQGGKLCSRTICMSARHFNVAHYHVHNIYASQEAILTNEVLKDVRNKRPFIISRASFPGHGHYAGVWTGDISSSWDDMVHSLSDVLSFSLFGIPMSGADICGFNQNTTVDLCERWSKVGAFYPFARNHNSIENFDQDPVALGPKVVEAARSSLLVRYSLLPYLYTLFWRAHTYGDTVARPMFVEFPTDDKTLPLYHQFLWGSGLLIAPLLTQDKLYLSVYLPNGRWYDFHTYKPVDSKGSRYVMTGDVSLFLRGGHIIPFQHPSTTTTLSRKNPMGLLLSLCPMGKAHGDLYWDDGDSLDHEEGIYNYITFTAAAGNLTSNVQQWKYNTVLQLDEVRVLGVNQTVTKVEVNGNLANFTYNPDVKSFNVTGLSVDLSQPFTLVWI